jgi:periplasmic protein TonB
MNRRGPGVRPVLASLALHLAILAPVLAFTRVERAMEFETIRITLVSAPAPVEATQPAPTSEPALETEADAPVETTPPEPVREEPRPEPTPQRQPEPPPAEQPRPTPDPTRPAPTPPRTPPADPAPGTDRLNIATEGRDFPFPEYLANVMEQVRRYFRWTEPTSPRGTVYFEIMSDGSVRNIRMVRPSGNLRFDFAVQGAVETAGTRGAFGPLPDAYAGPSLAVQMEVEPPR